MKYFFYIVIAVYLMMLTPCSSFAQTDSINTDLPFQVYAYSAPKGIMLVIIGDWVIPTIGDTKSGYHIYRKENATDSLVKITPLPLRAESSYTKLVTKVGQSLEGMFPIIGVADSAQFWQLLVDQDASIEVWTTMFKKFRQAMGLLQYDYDIELGKTYTYVCTKLDASGAESSYSQEITVTAGQQLFELLGPLDINAEAKDNKAIISWKINRNDSAAFSYNVYRAYDSLGRYLRLNSEILVQMINDETDENSEMSFVDTLAYNGRQYFYAVVSVDYADNESDKNNILSVSPQDKQAPSVPKNIKSDAGELGIKIRWDLSPEDDIAGYVLYRAFDKDSTFVKIHTDLLPLNANSYEDITTQTGDEYFYRLTAVDQSGNESEQSANIYGFYLDPSRPLPPMNLHAVSDSDKITLTWDVIENPEILGYYVFRTSTYKGEFSQVSELLPRGDTIWTDTSSLSSFSVYYYAMRSSTLNGDFSYYNEAVAVKPIQTNIALPQPPSEFYGYSDQSGIRLHWEMPLDKTVYGYNIYRSSEDGSLLLKLNDTVLLFSTTTYLDSLNLDKQTYSYHIKSAHFNGTEGVASHSVEISPTTIAPEPPSNLRASLQNNIVTLTWSKILLDGMQGYNIYRHTGDGSFVRVNKELITIESTEFKDADISNGQKYFYTITTVSNNNRESFHSKAIDILSN